MDEDGGHLRGVCRGDGGNGLLIAEIKNNGTQYYLHGVLSNSQREVECDFSFYALFTNIQDYKDVVNKIANI